MAGWDEILQEINNTPSNYDEVRRKYLKQLNRLTGRNVIAYYSGFLSKPKAPNTDINDGDMSGFMNALKGMDTSKGLDLILHTPGGNPTAAESIVKYLRSKFQSDIRVIVPHLAMSAGTMIACAGKTIIMGQHSSLGPVDPQINGLPAYDITHLYSDAKDEITKNPNTLEFWKQLINQYPPTVMYLAQSAISLSATLVKDWLGSCMFDRTNPSDAESIDRIVKVLNEHEDSKDHSRHIDLLSCIACGLKITKLEEDQKVQDAVLSLHHTYIFTLDNTNAVKIIENHCGKAMISMVKK